MLKKDRKENHCKYKNYSTLVCNGNPPGRVHGSFFAGYVQLASQNLYPIIAYYFVVNYRLYLCPLLGKSGMEWEPFVKY